MTLIDLTHPIAEGMPVFPETEPPEIICANSIEVHGFREKRLSLYSHTGTHMDAPAHMLPGGRTLDQYPIDRFSGLACVYRQAVGGKGSIGREQLRPLAKHLERARFLLIVTGWDRYWGTPMYFGDFPTLTIEAASWLSEFDLAGIGLDVISADPMDSTDFSVHMSMFKQDMVIIENLKNLTKLPDETCHFTCLPLLIEQADGAPVRAMAQIGT